MARFREQAGFTQRELAERMQMGEETIASIEQGRRSLKWDLAKTLDTLLDSKGALEVAVENMPEVDRIPAWAEEFVDQEQEALSLSSYEATVVPGLLQTEAYARAMFSNRVPTLPREVAEERTAGRIKRQQLLERKDPPTLGFVVWEPALLDRLGGEEVYTEQLQRLRSVVELPHVTLQVLPLGRTSHAGLSGPFVLIETQDHQHLAYSESQRGSQLVSDPMEVSILSAKCAMLRTQALNAEETKGLLDRLLGER